LKTVETIELFSDLDDVERRQLANISQQHTYQKGSILFYEGDQPKKLHLLLEGIVKVYKHHEKGGEVVLHYFQAQSLIAETAHIKKMLYPASAVCETPCQILEIDYALFEQHFLTHPKISLKIIYSLTKKLKSLQRVIDGSLTRNAYTQVCRFLYDNEVLINEMSHKNIASILNMSPETFSRNLAKLKKEKYIKVEKRKIYLLDKEALLKAYTDG
jgi:CRP/FNR family transcriptional regulator